MENTEYCKFESFIQEIKNHASDVKSIDYISKDDKKNT